MTCKCKQMILNQGYKEALKKFNHALCIKVSKEINRDIRKAKEDIDKSMIINQLAISEVKFITKKSKV